MKQTPLRIARNKVKQSDRERRQIQNDLRQWMRDGDFSPSSAAKGEAIRQRLIENVLGHDALVNEVVRLEQIEMDQLHLDALIRNERFEKACYIQRLNFKRQDLRHKRLHLEYNMNTISDAPSSRVRHEAEIETIEKEIEQVERKILEFQMGVLR